MRRTWSIRRRPRRRGGGRSAWRRVFDAKDSEDSGRGWRPFTRLQRAHARNNHDFLLSLFLSHFGTMSRTLLAHEMDGNFLRSGTSTYQRSCKINFSTITHCSTQAFQQVICSFAVADK
jgi:hypothetical protein